MGNQFKLLLRIMDSIRDEYLETDGWKDSPFAWIRCIPSRKVGAFAEALLTEWLRANGFEVHPSPDKEADRIVYDKRVEIKFSTLWRGGFYKFQQIRDQRYDILMCLGVSPLAAHLWVIPKERVMQAWRDGQIQTQHGGRQGRDTAWMTVDPKNVPEWLSGFGGSLEEGLQALRRILERKS